MTQTVVDAAITSRMSARAFTAQPVPRPLITELLQVASRAPSGTNTQPWSTYTFQGWVLVPEGARLATCSNSVRV